MHGDAHVCIHHIPHGVLRIVAILTLNNEFGQAVCRNITNPDSIHVHTCYGAYTHSPGLILQYQCLLYR